MPNFLVSALFAAALLVASAEAKNPDVNFDQGVDASSVLRSINGGEMKTLPPLQIVRGKLRKLKRTKMMVLVGSGIYPPVSPLITGSAPYGAALNLKADPKYGQIPPTDLQPLESEWTSINSIRGDLLSKAGTWEGDNGALYNDGAQLERDGAVIDQRKADLNAEIGRYNQTCTSGPLPPDQYNLCVAWRSDLINRKNRLDSDISQFNVRVDAWNQRSSSIFERRKALIIDISTWEARINQWQELVRKAIAAACRLLKSLESRPGQQTVFTGGFTQEFEARTFYENEPKDAPPCPVELFWVMETHPTTPNTVIGTISPTTGPKTIFKSGNFPGLAQLYVQDKKSGIGTASTINVRDPAKK